VSNLLTLGEVAREQTIDLVLLPINHKLNFSLYMSTYVCHSFHSLLSAELSLNHFNIKFIEEKNLKVLKGLIIAIIV
jgi:hypothetical protein